MDLKKSAQWGHEQTERGLAENDKMFFLKKTLEC